MSQTRFINIIKDYETKNREVSSNVYKSFISSDISIRIAGDIENLNWGESYFGAPLGSIIENTTSYGSNRDRIIKENVRDYLCKNPQYDKFVYINENDNVEVATGIAIKVHNSGYGIYLDPKSVVTEV